jgi:hypothetical protein
MLTIRRARTRTPAIVTIATVAVAAARVTRSRA